MIDARDDALKASGGVGCDLYGVLSSTAEGGLWEAASLIAGGFPPRGSRHISDSFHDWESSFLLRLRERLTGSAMAQLEAGRRTKDWRLARDASEALYRLAPHDEQAVALVIEARARVGRVQAAEVAYAEFVAAGYKSSAALEDVIHRVRSLRTPTGHQAAERRESIFVGRLGAVAELESVFQEVRSGVFTFSLILGEAGIGKTRLMKELERSARIAGLRCLAAQPVEVERRISMNPIIDALAQLDLAPHLAAIGEPWRTVIGTMMPPGPLAESVADLPPIQERSLSRRLLDAFSLLLRSIANEQPTIFFLDDLQWADATTVAALQFYQRRWAESFFGVVATVRPRAVGKKDPAFPYLSEDGKLQVRRVELGELGQTEARDLVTDLCAHEIAESDVAKLCALSGHHPLYLTELTRDYLSGRLTLPASEAEAFTIPVSIKQILASRTNGLSELAVSVLEILAVGSRPMRLDDIGSLVGVSLDCAADAADELARNQLTVLDRDQVWIGHDLFRAAVYRDLSEAHRAVLHLRIADHISERSGEEAASELATHLDRAGKTGAAADHGWTAAERAFERGAVAEAAHFYELVTKNEANEHRRAEATAFLATSLHLNRDIRRANPALELASSRLRAVGEFDGARRMDIRRVEGLAEAGDTPVNELVARLASIKAEARVEQDWEGLALALDVELQLLLLAEKLVEVRSLLSELTTILGRDHQPATAIAHRALALGLLLERSEDALGSAKRAVELSHGLGTDASLKALNRLLIVLLQRGSLHRPENRSYIDEAESLAERSGDLLQRFSFESNLGVSFLDAGELEIAHVHFDRAEELLGNADMTFPRINLAINRAELALAQNDYAEAAGSFTSVSALPGLAIPKYTKELVTAGLGLCALEAGRIGEARLLEESLGEVPAVWYYDPTIILTFRSKILERMRDLPAAVALLEDAGQGLEDRLISAWLKARLLLARTLRRSGDDRHKQVSEQGLRVARDLGLRAREREFKYLAGD
ncbi:MAG: AAA family ATPase [Gemmatimonadota bacterium]|nr:AAA family ATPase [Gemmatimonadota bacterium]